MGTQPGNNKPPVHLDFSHSFVSPIPLITPASSTLADLMIPTPIPTGSKPVVRLPGDDAKPAHPGLGLDACVVSQTSTGDKSGDGKLSLQGL